MRPLPVAVRARLPFLVAAFLSFLFSVFLYFARDEPTAGIFVGLWVPSILSLGTFLLGPIDQASVPRDRIGPRS